MSQEQSINEDTTNEEVQVDERTLLLQRARMMGLTVSNNIGLETLKERIRQKMENEEEPTAKQDATNPLADTKEPVKKKKTLRQHIHDEQMKLVRIRISNLDPKKKDLPGEIITIANEYLGTVKKYVPYGEFTDAGYHVPLCIYNALRRRKFLDIRVTKQNGGREVVRTAYVKEFSIEVLPPLTKVELAKLAAAQHATGSTSE